MKKDEFLANEQTFIQSLAEKVTTGQDLIDFSDPRVLRRMLDVIPLLPDSLKDAIFNVSDAKIAELEARYMEELDDAKAAEIMKWIVEARLLKGQQVDQVQVIALDRAEKRNLNLEKAGLRNPTEGRAAGETEIQAGQRRQQEQQAMDEQIRELGEGAPIKQPGTAAQNTTYTLSDPVLVELKKRQAAAEGRTFEPPVVQEASTPVQAPLGDAAERERAAQAQRQAEVEAQLAAETPEQRTQRLAPVSLGQPTATPAANSTKQQIIYYKNKKRRVI